MLEAVLSLTAIGVVSAVGIGIASRRFHVETDPRLAALEAALPGLNCGTCGFTGCAGYAESLLSPDTPLDRCAPGGARTLAALAAVLGREAGSMEERVAVLLCGGGAGKGLALAAYDGVADCRAALLVAGGHKACRFGCLGLGTCRVVCPFDAIRMGGDGLPAIDPSRCTACGKCVSACPRQVLALRPVRARVEVACRNPEPGPRTRAVCSAGCIGCAACEKVCPVEAVAMSGPLASIDPSRCVDCGLCAPACPTSAIRDRALPRPRAVVGEACNGCGICALVCPVDAVEGKARERHRVDPAACVGCGLCAPRCPRAAIDLSAAAARGT